MGEKVEGEKKAAESGQKKVTATDGGQNKVAEPFTVVLKLDLHCEGCAKKVRRAVTQFEGVEKVKTDCSVNKLTVTGDVDPTWLRERVEQKTKKKVDLISPLPLKIEEKPEKKPEQKKDDVKPQEAAVSTVVMKIKLHCDGCAHKIKRTILKNIDGVKSVTTDLQKDFVIVTGTMNAEELTVYLGKKLKRDVGIVPPPKKEDDTVGGEKKANEGGDKKEVKQEGDGDKKDKSEMKVEVINKMEYHSFNPQTHYAMPPMHYANQGYYQHQGYSNYGGYGGPPPPPPEYVNIDDQMFSDENPNGCSVM